MSKHSRWKATNTVPIRFRIFSILGLFLWIFSQLCSALDGGSSPFVLQNILLINHEPNKISLGVWEHGDFSQSLKSPLNSEFGYQARSVQGRAWIKRSHALSFDEAVARLFRELGLHEAIAIKTTDFLPFGPSTPNLPSVRQGSSLDHRFFFQGIPLCDFHARSHRLNDGSGLVMGDLPALEFIDLYRSFEDWPDLVITQSLVESSLDFAPRDDPSHVDNPTENPEKNEHLLTAEKCFHVAQHNILPTWMMTVRLRNGLIYAVLADEHHIYRLRPQFFSVNGTAKTWAHNRSTAPEAERILYDLVGDGTLKSEFLKTVVPIEFPPVQEPNHTFNYDINDRRIEEVTAYANAQDHLRWFQKLGFTWYSLKPLELRLHFSDLNNPNNANYYQGSVAKNIPPSITINDGDGIELQHLVTDGDVVGHELGHHVIYKTLRKIENDVLPLHEGLADFFVFARTGDPCLAETICPLGSKVCQMEGKCLRSADNTLTFNDEIWRGFPPVPNQKYGHRHGQLISGMLWDLQKSGRFAKDDLAIMVLKATSFFAEYADFCQFIKALYAADREIFANQHESSIRDAALKRGFYEFADPTQNC